ncbi:hypothetical protein AB3S75_017242 [Citrus x aurantiifolia]
MDINFRLFSERLRRVLVGEEVMLPDAVKQPIYNLNAEVEIVTSWLREFEDDISLLLLQKIGEVEIDNPDLGTVMDEINCFTYESGKVNQIHLKGPVSLAEVETVQWGLQLAKEVYLTSLIIKSDCLEVVQLVNNTKGSRT